MIKRLLLYGLFILLQAAPALAQKVIALTVDGTINPASAEYIRSGIKKAEKENAECLLIHLNTPGGLLKSTRVIVSQILGSPVPVIVFVSPGGAHAGSAGVFITLAAHIAAMAPGTNIGAAHPVSMQGMDSTTNEKATNDAAAFIRSIAGKRNRNLDWAENAVRRSFSYSETEALDLKAIDLLANNDQQLLDLVHGRQVSTSAGEKTLNTKDASIDSVDMDFIEKMLDILSDPNIAYILFLIGLYGLMFELYNPGAIFPGVIGVISLVLALYSMHTLPINYAGLALVVFSVILFILEATIVSHGLLAIGGVVSLLLGSMMLVRSGSSLELAHISRTVIITATVITAAFFLFVVGAGIRAQRAKPVTGVSGLIGETGIALGTLDPAGMIQVQGELWSAESIGGTVQEGGKVRVKEMKGLKLFVEPVNTQT